MELHFRLLDEPGAGTAAGRVIAFREWGVSFLYPADPGQARIDPGRLTVGCELWARFRARSLAREFELRGWISTAIRDETSASELGLRYGHLEADDREALERYVVTQFDDLDDECLAVRAPSPRIGRIEIGGDFDLSDSRVLAERTNVLIHTGHTRLVANPRRIRLRNSTAFAHLVQHLVTTQKRLAAMGGELVLAQPPKLVRFGLDVAAKELKVFPSEDAALRYLDPEAFLVPPLPADRADAAGPTLA